MNKLQNAIFVGLIYFLFTFGYIISRGFYHVGELFIIITITTILFLFYFFPKFLTNTTIPKEQSSLVFLLSIIATVNVALVGAHLGDSSQRNWQFFSMINRLLAAAALFLTLSFFLKKTFKQIEKFRLPMLLAIAIAIRVFSILSAPGPTIDVYYILRDGPKQILEGKNPYEMSYPAPFGVYTPKIVFVYGPLTPFLFLPSVVLFNDPRFTLVLVDIVSAFFLYKIGTHLKIDKKITFYVITILLFHPLFPFMTEQAWLEPIMTVFLFASLYFFLKNKNSILGSIFLGTLLGIKSVYIIPILTFLKIRGVNSKQYLVAVLVPLAFTIPFLILNYKLFLERTQVYVTNPSAIQGTLAPTNIALNIAAVILKYTHFVIPSYIVAGLGVATSILLIIKRRQEIGFALVAMFLVFIVLFMFGPFVFAHYFAFLGNILLLSVLTFSKE